MSQLNPAQFRLLLAGPRVSRLLPFFSARGYVADAASEGATALEYLRESPRHVLLVELELGDMLLPDLLQHVHAENLAGAVILLEDPARSGLIVSALIRGIDGYVATPPDENYLFRLIERQLLAQWALAQSAQTEASAAELARLEKNYSLERAKVLELVKEIASLREEVAASRAEAAARASNPNVGKYIPGFDDDMGGPQVPVAPSPHMAPRPQVPAMTAPIRPQPAPTAPAARPSGAAAIRGGSPRAQPSLNDLDDLDQLENLTTGIVQPPAVLPSANPTFDDLDVVRGNMEELELDDDEDTNSAGEFDEPTNFNPMIASGPGASGVLSEATMLKTNVGKPAPAKPAPARPTPARPVVKGHIVDDATSPAGWQRPDLGANPPSKLRDDLDDDLDGDLDGMGFEDIPSTTSSRTELVPAPVNKGPTRPAPKPAAGAALKSKEEQPLGLDDDSGSDLFLDLDEELKALEDVNTESLNKSDFDDLMLDDD